MHLVGREINRRSVPPENPRWNGLHQFMEELERAAQNDRIGGCQLYVDARLLAGRGRKVEVVEGDGNNILNEQLKISEVAVDRDTAPRQRNAGDRQGLL